MNKLDRDERIIYEEISKIDVDTSQLNKSIMKNLENKNNKLKRKKSFIISIVTISMSLFLIIGASAAILKNSEWFMDQFNPTFKEIVEPIDIYSEDKGIRVELISGQKYDNNALVYLSIKDTSGKNRITENTEFRDGFFLGMNPTENSFGYGMQDKVIDFDKDTNTIYYEFNISTDIDSPLSKSLKLGSSRIYFDFIEYKDELIEIPAKDIKNSKHFNIEESKIWGGSNLSDHAENILEMDNYSDMPHGDKNQWISNVGIIDGKIHIQIASNYNKDFGPVDPYFTMKNINGQVIEYESSLIFLTDEDNNILDINQIESDLVGYKYKEYIFPIVKSQEIYEFYYSGSVYDGVLGHWEIEADLTKEDNNIITIDEEFKLGDYIFKNISLNPLGLNASVYYSSDNCKDDFKIEIETEEGLIELDDSGRSLDQSKLIFHLDFKTKNPISVDKVKSIIINDIKVPVK